MIELRLLGPPQVVGSNQQEVDTLTRQPKRLALLAYLATAIPRGLHRRDKLLALFWPELDEAHARNALSQALYVLRTALGDNTVVTHGDTEVGIADRGIWSDVTAFDTAINAGRHEEALLLYRGDLLDGFFVSGAPEFERWLDAERTRFKQRASQSGWSLARIRAEEGNALDAERHARWAANLLLPDETQIRQLMIFLHDLGDRSAAIRAYEEFAGKLSNEYELEPSAQSQALAKTIREDAKPGSLIVNQSGLSFQPYRSSTDAIPGEVTPPAGPAQARASPDRRTAWVLTVLLLVAVAGIVTAFGVKERTADKVSVGSRVPRLVVVPLQNLGAPENAYFAEGISDEIATRLATLRGLHVIGGTAAQRYKTIHSHDAPGERADVDYFLEGTASWVPSGEGRGQVRVRLQLVSGRDRSSRWGAVLEENISTANDLFTLYSSIAQRVVNELDIVLETPRQSVVIAIPTKSLEAYNDYLRGRDYLRRTSTAINLGAAIQSLERAVERDTSFALAFAVLSNAHIEADWLAGMGPRHLPRAKAAAERALAIDPGLPEGHAYLGWYYYVCCEDYERAMWYLTKSNAIRQGNAEVMNFIGNVHKRQGRWAESVRYFEEAARLDPLARWPLNNRGHAQMWARRYDDAEKTFRRVLALEPQDIFAYAHLAWVLVLRDGDTRAARRVVGQAAGSSDGFAEMRIPFYLEILDRRYDAALVALTAPEPPLITSLLNEWLVSDELRRGLVQRLRGDSAAARVQFDLAREELEAALRGASPDSRRAQLWLRSALGVAYAALGRRSDALAEVKLVLAADPLKVDAIEGPKYLQHIALAHVLLGNRGAAAEILERLLSVGAPVSRHSLRLEPFWDSLRSEPRFARLVRERE